VSTAYRYALAVATAYGAPRVDGERFAAWHASGAHGVDVGAAWRAWNLTG
jgi:hypothetical protein